MDPARAMCMDQQRTGIETGREKGSRRRSDEPYVGPLHSPWSRDMDPVVRERKTLHETFWRGEGPSLILIPTEDLPLYDTTDYETRFRDPVYLSSTNETTLDATLSS